MFINPSKIVEDVGLKKTPNAELIKIIEWMNNDERINYFADNPIIEHIAHKNE